jgi:hypothetical protein
MNCSLSAASHTNTYLDAGEEEVEVRRGNL